MSIKNPTLRRRTKELTECADDAKECQLLGYELKELGNLVASMAIHMGDLQRKIDSQAEHIKDLNEKLADRKTEPLDKDINVRSKTEPQTAECPFDDAIPCEWVCTEYGNCKYKPKTEPQTETHDIHTETHECVKDTHDNTEPQTEQNAKR